MEWATSNLTSQVDRHGDYKLRLTRSAAYVGARVAPPLPRFLQVCPVCGVLGDTRVHFTCPNDSKYIWIENPWRW